MRKWPYQDQAEFVFQVSWILNPQWQERKTGHSNSKEDFKDANNDLRSHVFPHKTYFLHKDS